jgi:transposase-like protein
MKITACSRCGSTNLRQGSLRDGLLSGLSAQYVCRDCKFQAVPFIFDSEEDYLAFLKRIKER